MSTHIRFDRTPHSHGSVTCAAIWVGTCFEGEHWSCHESPLDSPGSCWRLTYCCIVQTLLPRLRLFQAQQLFPNLHLPTSHLLPPTMPPKKAHDDSEPKSTHAKDKNGHGHANGKMRRVASSTGSNLKEVTNAANMPSPPTEAAVTSAPAANPSVSLPMSQSQEPR